MSADGIEVTKGVLHSELARFVRQQIDVEQIVLITAVLVEGRDAKIFNVVIV